MWVFSLLLVSRSPKQAGLYMLLFSVRDFCLTIYKPLQVFALLSFWTAAGHILFITKTFIAKIWCIHVEKTTSIRPCAETILLLLVFFLAREWIK